MRETGKLPWTGSRILTVDAPSGISGDMFLAALADLGFDLDELQTVFRDAGFEVKVAVSETRRSGLRGRLLELTLPEGEPRRGLFECLAIIDKLDLPEPVKDLSRRFFERLAEVEGRVHGLPREKVHFHEVGAMDTLIDLVGAALGIFRLEVGELRLRDLLIGHGTVLTEHGELPLPAPATLELLSGFSLRESGEPFELTTPTGAVILACTCEPLRTGSTWTLLRTGYGAGRREIKHRPNLLRLGLSESSAEYFKIDHDVIKVMSSAMDDHRPEEVGHLMGRLLDEGALDVSFIPLQMKKNRPGLGLEVLCRENDIHKLARIILRESTTLGLRIRDEERWVLPREMQSVQTDYGSVLMKVAHLPGGGLKASPEYEDCARLASEHGLSLLEVDAAARAAWRSTQEIEAEA